MFLIHAFMKIKLLEWFYKKFKLFLMQACRWFLKKVDFTKILLSFFS